VVGAKAPSSGDFFFRQGRAAFGRGGTIDLDEVLHQLQCDCPRPQNRFRLGHSGQMSTRQRFSTAQSSIAQTPGAPCPVRSPGHVKTRPSGLRHHSHRTRRRMKIFTSFSFQSGWRGRGIDHSLRWLQQVASSGIRCVVESDFQQPAKVIRHTGKSCGQVSHGSSCSPMAQASPSISLWKSGPAPSSIQRFSRNRQYGRDQASRSFDRAHFGTAFAITRRGDHHGVRLALSFLRLIGSR